MSTFLVPTDLDGVERVGNDDKMGMRTTPFGDITLTDVVVPASAMIGREGAGAAIFDAVLQVERSFVFATQVGAMQRQMEDSVAYASTRVQGGHTIGSYQAVSHRIADMKQRHETAPPHAVPSGDGIGDRPRSGHGRHAGEADGE